MNQSFWLKLLNISAENLFEVSQSATLLTSAVQGGLQSLGQLLIRRGVSLDAVDGAGLSAIMYSLIYNDEIITQDLIDRLALKQFIHLTPNIDRWFIILAGLM